MPKQYPQNHQNEIWDAPRFIFSRGVTIGSLKASRYLGMCYPTFLASVDDFGLTVLRKPDSHRRYFLKSELRDVKIAIANLSAEDIVNTRGAIREIPALKQAAKKRRRKAKRSR